MALVASAGESSAAGCLVGYGCGDVQLCKEATVLNGSVRTWKPYQSALKTLAKKRGLTCGVGNSAASNTAPLFRKSDFLALNSTRRKQLQYGLKKLGYYTSSIDGAYGPNTQRAVRGYATAKGITSGYPASVYNRIVGEVNVPSSFAVAKRPSTSSSSSSSASSSSGLTAIVSSPSVPANQAIAICEPMASQAASNAENSYSAPKTKKSYKGKCEKDYFGNFDCTVRDSTSSGGFAAGFANAASGWLDGRKAGSRAYKSCLASYGWRKN
jgi:hypothetical protein